VLGVNVWALLLGATCRSSVGECSRIPDERSSRRHCPTVSRSSRGASGTNS